ncbi:cell cycle regulatory protein [Durotheca rogersii]|uniref:cell cycle regulatory protein n=1 Tax=Durotheca rogersii TaxID=419775 RepID=UPI0022211A16|nr:cell cycle regulatory protein [Durotheca rogersii]KAI5864806.1 cell cycle regulatory protein [Durotheca rogersii]
MAMNIDVSRRNKAPRPLSDDERARLEEYIDSIHYSARYEPHTPPRPRRLWRVVLLTMLASYSDSEYEYRHVQLPKAMLKVIPKDYHDAAKGTLKLLWEDEWRAIGITQVGRSACLRSSYIFRLGC